MSQQCVNVQMFIELQYIWLKPEDLSENHLIHILSPNQATEASIRKYLKHY